MVIGKVKARIKTFYNLLIKRVFHASCSHEPSTYVIGSLFLTYAPYCWLCLYTPWFVIKRYPENYL